LIKHLYILSLVVIISLILPLQYSVLKFANGQILKDSEIMIFNSDSKSPVLADDNTILKPKVHVLIEGTSNSDKLKGGIGDDKINGKYGNDLLLGKEGNDKIDGGIGDDKISGQGGNDIIKGELGDDILFGGKGDDQVYGNLGNDSLDGGQGINIMAGGTGSDTFLCNQYDMVMDFNASEADQIIGSCKGQSNEVIAISDNNINHPNKSGFESTLSLSPKSETPSPLPLIANDTHPNFEPTFQFNPKDVNHVDFQSLPSLSIPLNDIDMKELQFN
jgi:Ca2+-binding RTX toxin-like protein